MNITLSRPSASLDDDPADDDRTDGERAAGDLADAGHVVAFVAVVAAVLVLLVLLLTLGVRWLAAEAATAASQSALEIAQAPGGTDGDVRAAATGLATSVSLIASVDVIVTRADDTVTVTVTTHDRLGGTVSRSATGPVIRFVPQTRPSS